MSERVVELVRAVSYRADHLAWDVRLDGALAGYLERDGDVYLVSRYEDLGQFPTQTAALTALIARHDLVASTIDNPPDSHAAAPHDGGVAMAQG
jgi:hypothetical protein